MPTNESFKEERDRLLASLPSIVTRVSGRIGNVIFTNRDGKTITTPAPDLGPTGPTPEKLAQALKFRELKTEAERLLQDPSRRSYYEKIGARKGISALAAAFADQVLARSRREKRRAERRKAAQDRRRNRVSSLESSLTAPPTIPSFPPLGIDAILAHIASLTPAETELLRAKLQEAVERMEEGLREQGAGI